MPTAAPARPQSAGSIPIEFIDPARAEDLLTRNESNRDLSEGQVESFARQMANDQWFSADKAGGTVLIGEGDSLKDGQHRMRAVVKSGKGQYFGVVYDVPQEAQDVVDNGRKRSAVDTLKMLGVPNSAVAAGAVRTLLAWGNGEITRTVHSIGNIEARAFYQETGENLAAAVRTAILARGNSFPVNQGALAALLYELGKSADQATLDKFIDRLVRGNDLKDGDPEKALRNLVNNRKDQRKSLSRSEALYYLIRAWNARVKGQRLIKMQPPRTGITAQTFPRPITNASDSEFPNVSVDSLLANDEQDVA